MLKFLYFGDIHGGSKAPKYRTDDFVETRANKIRQILEIAKKHEVVALLQAGDFLNKPNISPEYLTKELINWTSVNINDIVFDIMMGEKSVKDLELALKNVFPMIGTIGNHELIGGELDSFEKTSLNTLVQMGFMTLVDKDNPLVFKDEDGMTVAITASPYTHQIDDDDKSAYIVEDKTTDYHIHMAHGMLMPKSYGKKFKHTVVSEIAYDTKADLTINGHDHIGYDEIELDGKKFINPGSPLRLSAENKEISRMPKVLLISISKEEGITLEPIYLEAEKGEDVLSREHLEIKTAKSEKMEEIQSLMNKAGLKKGVDITEIIDNVGKAKGLPTDVVNDVISDIVESMNKLMTPFNSKGEYIIERLELINWESHKHSVFEFSKGLNVLAGGSRSGKSSVLRSIRELFECYSKKPRSSIFLNEKFFKITAYLSNGYIISRYVEKKSNGKNGYEIFDPMTGELSYYNTKALPMVQEILGLNKVKLTDKNKINVNFTSQGESWFFIGNGLSSPDRAKLIGVMYGTHYADAVLKDINSQSKKVLSEIGHTNKELKKLEDKAKDYAYLSELNNVFIEAEGLLKEVEELDALIEKGEALLKDRQAIENECIELKNLIQSITQNKDELEILLKEITEDNEVISKIEGLISDCINIVKDGKEFRYILNKLSHLNTAKTLIDDVSLLTKEIEDNELVLNKAIALNSDIKSISSELKNLSKLKKDLASVEHSVSLIDEIKKLEEEIEKEELSLSKANQLLSEQKDLAVAIKESKMIFNQLSQLHKTEDLINEINALDKEITESEAGVNQLKSIQEEIQTEKKNLSSIKKDNVRYLEEYKVELEKLDKCPICHGTIDSVVINGLLDEWQKK